ncbi:desmoglein-2-like protein [Genypterus blacodes]|uniref:desmoglein-2-like protein n=1 Tax=Genypterus blacodes TaxID=154954 RepID=UPI003F7657EA
MTPLLRCSLILLLPFLLALDCSVQAEGNGPTLRRQKREWILAPRRLVERHDYTTYKYIAKIRSDKENFTKIVYSIRGPGVNQEPYGIFSVNSDNGFVRVHSILDREEREFYLLKGSARYQNGSAAEKDIDLKITVEDVNDCAPVIQSKQVGYVKESSAAGTVVMKVIATDADKANTRNSEIYYSLSSSSSQMFSINSQTGEIMVRQNTLDRESQGTYTLSVQVSDLNGQGGGNSGSGDVTVTLLDINDNVPTLERETYEGSVEENTVNTEVMRIKAIDMDMIHTDNWLAAYQIVSGNEAGYFSITTDSKTNEGIIMINKALDYEQRRVLNLGVVVANKAGYEFGPGWTGGIPKPKPYPIKINVVNQKEGPRFKPSVKVVTVSEESKVSLNQIITNYHAIDSDTLKAATNVRYAKFRDEDNWIIIDEKTADIRLSKWADRESKYLKNGTYYAEIVCISNDIPEKTATGTIAISVEDSNDNCPKLTSTSETMCIEQETIWVTAEDNDQYPNAGPFEFNVIEKESQGTWSVEPFNETTAILRDHANLWTGIYKVAMEIKDQQGRSCGDVQTVDVTVCTCHETTNTCLSRRAKRAGLGAAGVLLLLLGLLLLLLVPLLLLFCLCGGSAALGNFKAIPFDAKQQLISYHTEGQGEDKEVPLLQIPAEVDHGTMTAVDVNRYGGAAFGGGVVDGAVSGGGMNTSTLHMDRYSKYRFSGHSGMDDMEGGTMTMTGREQGSRYRTDAYDGLALPDHFLGEYYSSKANHATEQSQLKDSFLVYDYEGRESLAGSVGCCSLLENDNDLAFLDDLGPKFKTLAGICQGSTIVTESVSAAVSARPPIPVAPAMPTPLPTPSTHTHLHTHTETIRDRGVNVNTLNTSNVASESSTLIQEHRLSERAQGSATIPKVHIQENVVVSSPTMLIQQPAMYYTTAPMYVVEPKPQMVLVAGGTQQAVSQIGHMGLNQGYVQVGGIQGSQGLMQVGTIQGSQALAGVTQQAVGQVSHMGLGQGFVQVGGIQGSQGLMQVGGIQGSQGLMQVGGIQGPQGLMQVGGVQGSPGVVQVGGIQGSQGVMLVERQAGMDGTVVQTVPGFSQGTVPRSRQVLVVDNGSVAGSCAQSGGHVVQTFVQTSQGSAGQGFEVRGQGAQLSSSPQHGSLGSYEDLELTTTPKLQGSKRVVVQHKKVSVTERNTDTGTTY